MKQKLTKLLCSVFLVAFAIPAIAQSSGGSSTRTITGKVTDSEGAPIIGAVVMASQREATTTNSEGRYTLAVQSPDAVLRFSCMGYRPRSENTAGRTVVDVSLETDNQLLEDVVVVGYGVQKKVNLTGSVASIDFSKTSESRSIISTSAALAGLAAGMNVTQSSGQPGSDNATIRIRGDGSFTSGANGPLVLVDGVEWSMDNVNPNDIASISVLKDAASASIYGTRAANGVILITTKNGSSGKAQISYSYPTRASCKCPTTTCTSFRITPGTWSLSTSRATTSGPRASSPSRTSTSGGRSRPIPTGSVKTASRTSRSTPTPTGSTRFSRTATPRSTTSRSRAGRRRSATCSRWATSTIRASWGGSASTPRPRR